MRIAIVTGPFLSVPPAPCGAVERLWLDLAKEFAKAGHEVRLLACGAAGVPDEEEAEGVHVRRLGRQRGTRRLAANAAKDLLHGRRMAAAIPPSDIVVSNSLSFPLWFRLRDRRTPLVVNVNRAPKGQMRLYEAAGVDLFACASKWVARAVRRECTGSRSRVVLLPNPIDGTVFHPGSSTIRERGRILYAGRIHPEKGLEVLVEGFRRAVDRDPALSLRIVGPWRVEQGGGGREYRDRLERMARGLALEFVEPISDRARLAEELRTALVFCSPSLALGGEALPVAPLEAMACGAAVACSDLPQFRDYLVPGRTGLVFRRSAPDPAEDLARELVAAATDEQLRTRLAANGVRMAKRFATPRIARIALEQFEEAIARKRRA